MLSGIVYRLRTGSQWKALLAQFGSGSVCHARLRRELTQPDRNIFALHARHAKRRL
jgi:transposase